jgi:NADH dehydrogenase [ubiquinone] 1 alpha subcomplex assembly factor 5
MPRPAPLFDRAAHRAHRSRAVRRLERVRPVLEATAEMLLERLDEVRGRFETALDLGGRGVIAPRLRERGLRVIAADPAFAMAEAQGRPAVVLDADVLPFAAGTFDVVVAHFALHWVEDLPRALLELREALRPGGLLLASVPLGGTLAELRTALIEAETTLRGGVSPRLIPLPDLRDLAALLQAARFALPVVTRETLRLAYADPAQLLADLRDAGEANALTARSRRPPPRRLFAEALARLPRNREGRVEISLTFAILTAFAPDPPLASPGGGG